jgi:benzoyl-CoA reductase/2-hydroxyglutaryl-CoA dehydratase subunit BcrC/BadD/HgdB
MSDTLCSYHKCFIGAADTEILKPPLLSITTTLACDGNVNTFRFLEQRLGVKSFVIDVPYEYTKESLRFVSEQLYNLISVLEELTGKRFDERILKAAIVRENESRALQEKALSLGAMKKYPTSLTLHMFKLFVTHILSGSKEAFDYYQMLVRDLRKYPDADMVKIMWIHLMPYYQKTLKQYLGEEGKYQIVLSDFDFDYGSGVRLDPEKPVEAIAEKLLCNIYNGPYSRKTTAALDAAKTFDIDGIIHFCHWGCKQSAGGAFEMKQVFDETGIPFLILDGDGIDKRNDSPEQIRTRAEAFFEMLDERRRKGDSAEK